MYVSIFLFSHGGARDCGRLGEKGYRQPDAPLVGDNEGRVGG